MMNNIDIIPVCSCASYLTPMPAGLKFYLVYTDQSIMPYSSDAPTVPYNKSETLTTGTVDALMIKY